MTQNLAKIFKTALVLYNRSKSVLYDLVNLIKQSLQMNLRKVSAFTNPIIA